MGIFFNFSAPLPAPGIHMLKKDIHHLLIVHLMLTGVLFGIILGMFLERITN
jgi:hypothetical protein